MKGRILINFRIVATSEERWRKQLQGTLREISKVLTRPTVLSISQCT